MSNHKRSWARSALGYETASQNVHRQSNLWGIILAGGEGERLRDFVRSRLNSDRPKQFCAFSGTQSMLARTIQRVEPLVRRSRLLVSMNSRHGEFARPDIGLIEHRNLVVQPENRETGAGLLLPLLHVWRRDPDAVVAVFPADHFIRPKDQFLEYMNIAVRYVEENRTDLLLVGAEPQYPETDYGWIEPSEVVATDRGSTMMAVRRFCEKPTVAVAQELAANGALWNTMIMVGSVTTFLWKFRRLTSSLYDMLAPVVDVLETPMEEEFIRSIYGQLPRTNFSVSILQREVNDLVVLPARGVYWSDWGKGERIELDLALLAAERTQDRVAVPD